MNAFAYANHNPQRVNSGQGFHLVGVLELPPGNFIVVAKADIGTDALWSYPGPPYPDGGGALALSLGTAQDTAYAAVKPEPGSNRENVAVMVASKIDTRHRARLHFINPWPLPIWVNEVRITALQIDDLTIHEEGSEDLLVPEERPDRSWVTKMGPDLLNLLANVK